MRKLKKIDVLGIKKISKQDLSEEIRCEIDVLGVWEEDAEDI